MDIIAGIRPVNMSLADGEGFAAMIDGSEMMGSELHLHMSIDGGKDVVAVIPTANLDLNKTRSGSAVRFTFDPALMHLFNAETEENLI